MFSIQIGTKKYSVFETAQEVVNMLGRLGYTPFEAMGKTFWELKAENNVHNVRYVAGIVELDVLPLGDIPRKMRSKKA